VLYAAIIAQATNLGLTGMSRASEFSYQQLEWAWVEFPRFRGHLTVGSSDLAGRMSVDAKDPAVFVGVPPGGGSLAQVERAVGAATRA